ncbi:hypothetical protein [Mucilaginibacter paludis]|uniref:Uncharacterized protein n=1 Tax=Mucilaginibacter paludis DSM 18603 TaxID=714943 RepID=H1Y605_9SPHI|nr:hypothetical protein [Mucilaginibacter paludis]EHQ30964.1 hypothetical protein Mucpa_6915 [Mucilaginibacter paludis DSM 18603]
MISLHEFKTGLAVIVMTASITLDACTKKKDCCAVADMHMDFDTRYKNGTSVFDTSASGHLTQDSIQIYYLTEGKYNLVQHTGYDASEGFLLLKEAGLPPQYTIRLILSDHTDSNNFSYTLMRYGSLKTDTIQAVIQNHVKQKIWLNSKQITVTGKPYINTLK